MNANNTNTSSIAHSGGVFRYALCALHFSFVLLGINSYIGIGEYIRIE